GTQRIARTDRAGCRLGARTFAAGALGRLGLDFAYRLFQSEPFAGDLRFAQRRLDAAKLGDQRRSRALVERTTALAGGAGVQAGDGAGNERVVVCHPRPVSLLFSPDPAGNEGRSAYPVVGTRSFPGNRMAIHSPANRAPAAEAPVSQNRLSR